MRQKRFLSWLLTLCLLLGMFSFPAYAEGNTTTISGDGTADKTGTMTITLVIPKKTPAATDLTYTAPSDLTYSGSDKTATVDAASGVTGLGTITVKYYSDASRTTEAAPKNVGTYYVGATVAEGDQYAASTAVLYGDGWTFTITASTPSAPAAPTKASATKNSITLNAVSGCEYSKDGATYQDSTEFTGLMPGTEYTFYQRVKATANTNASAASSASFTTEADTYAMTITLVIKPAQTITASDVTATYGDTDKSVSASVTEPTTGGGAITYAVKDGSGDYIDVAADGKLTIKAVPPTDGKAYVIVTAAETDDYAEATKEVVVTISKATVTVAAENQSIYVGGTVPDLSAPVLDTHYSVTGLVGEDTLTTAPTLAYQKNGSAVTPDNTTAGTYDIVPFGAAAGDNYAISYTNGTLTITARNTQTITASDVTATYGDTDKSVSATTDGNGEISYTVKAGSENYIDVNTSTGALTIKEVPADGKAYVTVKATETTTGGTSDKGYAAATKDVTVNISKATVTITAKDQSIYVGGTVPTLSGTDFYTVTGLVETDTLTTNPTLKYQKNDADATPDSNTAGTYDIVPSGASAGDNYTISYTNGTLTISNKGTQTISAENVTATYGDTDKSVSATVTDPATGGGDISYAVKEGSGDYIEINASTGALTIKAVPADGKAYVIVTAAETGTYTQATKEVTVTINKANAVAATVTANSRTYDGTEQPLVTVTGEPTGGEMQYALGTATEATQPYTTSIPTATNAGTYYVWYKVVGDANHLDSEAKPVEAAIGSVDSNTAAPTELTLTYDGSGQPLVKPGSVDYGTLFYALGSNDTTAPTDGWSTEVPTATKAGTYYVWYKVVGDANHNDVDPACVVVTIGEAAAPATTTIVAPAASTSDYTLLASLKTSGKKALKMRWTAVPGAEGYDVFFGMCNKGDCQLLASVNGTSYKIKGLKKGFAYKAYVRAWKNVGGAKVYIGEPSPDVHAITNGKSNRYTNPKKISVKKKKLTVGVGKTKAIKAKLKKFSDSREYLNHVSAKVRYYSSDRAVATVSANGRVTGVGPGKCTVFVVAENGLRVGVKVTVK